MAASYSTSTKSTYVKIASYTVPSSTSSYTFSNIPQNFTDLALVCVQQGSTSYVDAYIYVGNGSVDTGTNYSSIILTGNGSAATAARQTSSSKVFMDYNGAPPISSSFNIATTHFMSYSNGSIYKTWLTRAGNAGTSGGTDAICGTWRSTAAINTIKVELTGSNYAAGTTFTLYGIEAAKTPKATGGIVTTDGAYWYHTFRTTGLLTPMVTSLAVDYLIVAGGGGGGSQQGGGGGAGGVRAFSSQTITSTTPYIATIGSGGAGANAISYSSQNGFNGNNTSFNSTSVTGGGCGGGHAGISASYVPKSGGSGGGYGIGGTGSGASGNAGGYSPVEGYAGGGGSGDGGAGGGGAGGNGSNKSGTNGQTGGSGTQTYNSINFSSWLAATGVGVSNYVGGGGGGGTHQNYSSGGTGGTGGGGTGGYGATAGNSGTAGSGGGGGGGGQPASGSYSDAGNGGSGVVIVRYAV